MAPVQGQNNVSRRSLRSRQKEGRSRGELEKEPEIIDVFTRPGPHGPVYKMCMIFADSCILQHAPREIEYSSLQLITRD
jgi:hypothetical protein